ncbi:cytochrome c [Stagnihabitans tardus]|uniref:C-type cytochrome n=1 Tax=Stagnihabitans tardus TaxID=2699202 RepID=A0AAE4YB73_9RHOB|nr:cytochrome c [Stagnihabitans tardus]NBZ88719.1 c-type cytochrome [Stagnihabitans tardus]
MGRLFRRLLALAVMGAAIGWFLTAPTTRATATAEALTPDPAHGETVFWASGCASCHAAPEAKGEAVRLLSGGQKFATAFGTFLAPNISPSKEGIGDWTLAQFIHAVQDGVLPDGSHEYPAMPYVAYAKMTEQDIVDLHAFIGTLPASDVASQPHEVGFPFNIRRSLGGWKLLFGNPSYVLTGNLTPEVERGRYIAEAMAHCGECHTPRNGLGGLDTAKWLGGGVIEAGAKVPNITPGGLDWSEDEILTYLTTGATPDFDFVGGAMAHVVDNMGHLAESDVKALVAYLKAVPAVSP